ncbi:MAG TPA: hypothetical protein VKT73_04640 [Xanthobacteraceae bacterium]|nr:hypothetical protein [Xanthobacteraceae bacterium]
MAKSVALKLEDGVGYDLAACKSSRQFPPEIDGFDFRYALPGPSRWMVYRESSTGNARIFQYNPRSGTAELVCDADENENKAETTHKVWREH